MDWMILQLTPGRCHRYFFWKMAWYALWLTQPPIWWVLEALSSILKQPAYDTNHLLPSVHRFRMGRGTPLLPPVQRHSVHTPTPVPLPCAELKSLNLHAKWQTTLQTWYRGADKSLARPTSQCILFDGENILFDASLVIYTNSINIPPIMIINMIYENQNLLSL